MSDIFSGARRLNLWSWVGRALTILALVAALYFTELELGDLWRVVGFVSVYYGTYILLAPFVHNRFGHEWKGARGPGRTARMLVCGGTALLMLWLRWDVAAGMLMVGIAFAAVTLTADVLRKRWWCRHGEAGRLGSDGTENAEDHERDRI